MRNLGHARQRRQARPTRVVQPGQARRHQDPVLAGQGDEVRNRSQRDEIEEMPQIQRRPAGAVRSPLPFHEGVGELERKPDRAELTTCSPGGSPMRIDQGHRRGCGIRDLVMIDDNGVQALLAQPRNRLNSGRAAIDRNQQACRVSLEGVGNRFPRQAVPLFEPVREVPLDGPAQRRQHLEQQRRRRDPIHVVVPEYQNSLAPPPGRLQTLDRHRQVGDVQRIGQVLEPRFEELAGRGAPGHPPVPRDSGPGAGGHRQLRHEPGNRLGLGWGQDPAVIRAAPGRSCDGVSRPRRRRAARTDTRIEPSRMPTTTSKETSLGIFTQSTISILTPMNTRTIASPYFR